MEFGMGELVKAIVGVVLILGGFTALALSGGFGTIIVGKTVEVGNNSTNGLNLPDAAGTQLGTIQGNYFNNINILNAAGGIIIGLVGLVTLLSALGVDVRSMINPGRKKGGIN